MKWRKIADENLSNEELLRRLELACDDIKSNFHAAFAHGQVYNDGAQEDQDRDHHSDSVHYLLLSAHYAYEELGTLMQQLEKLVI